MAIRHKIEFIQRNPGFLLQFMRLQFSLRNSKLNKKSTWLFQCDFEGHFPYLKPYYDIAKSDSSIEVYFSIGIRDTEESPFDFLLKQGISKNRIIQPADYVALLNFDLYLSPTEWGNIFPKNKNCVKTQIFHTLADKGLEYSKELLGFNTIFMNGPLHHEFMEKYIYSKYPHANEICQTFDVGYAKIDDLFDGRYSRSEGLKKLGITDAMDRKVVLYAPNWENTSALHKYGEEVFAELQASGHIILIKLHYMSLLSKDNIHATGGVDWRQVLQKYSLYENVVAIYDTNINPYLYLADVMVTDYGGASFEFMVMDKPIIYLDCPGFFDDRGHSVFEKASRSTGHLLDDVSRLNSAISDAISNDPFTFKRKELASRLLYNKGMAAQKGIAVLKTLVDERIK